MGPSGKKGVDFGMTSHFVNRIVSIVRKSRYEVSVFSWFFFFQAEDGIRDLTVTGVQTCALPICLAVSCVVSSGRACCRSGPASFQGNTSARGRARVASPRAKTGAARRPADRFALDRKSVV